MTPLSAYPSAQVGTLTQLQGEVMIFSHPSKKIQGPAPHALFEGEYYSVQPAKVGHRLERGNIVRTALGAKARIVFDNGDQFNVGSATAYRVFWDKDSAKTDMHINLMYGKIRGIIEKGGPRSRLKVKTHAAVMGVRGTDFFIADGGTDNSTEISVLRGEVQVQAKANPAKAVPVKAGLSVEIAADQPQLAVTQASPTPPPVEIRKTTQEELHGIQRSFVIKQEIKEQVQASQELTGQIKKLESKAVEMTLKDVKTEDPKLYAQIQSKPLNSVDEINAHAVKNILKTAPKAPAKRKPYKSELDLDDRAYEKYFKIE